jgi:hypothetical protein
MPSIFEDKKTKIILAIVVIVLLLWWFNKSNSLHNENDTPEQFGPGRQPTGDYVVAQHVEPAYYDPQSGTMMTSPDYIPQEIEPAWGKQADNLGHYDAPNFNAKVGAIDRATDIGDASMAFDMCSKSCCADQYPLPFNLPGNPEVCQNKGDFVPSSYMCNNNWEDAGCLCMTKRQSNMLATRAGNL